MAVKLTAEHRGGHAGLLKGVLGFCAAEGDVRTDDAVLVFEHHREVLEEVGQTTHLQFAAVLIREGDVTQPAGGQAIAIDHGANAEQTTFGRTVADVVVEGQLFGDGPIGLGGCCTLGNRPLSATGDLCFEVVLIPLVAGGAE